MHSHATVVSFCASVNGRAQLYTGCSWRNRSHSFLLSCWGFYVNESILEHPAPKSTTVLLALFYLEHLAAIRVRAHDGNEYFHALLIHVAGSWHLLTRGATIVLLRRLKETGNVWNRETLSAEFVKYDLDQTLSSYLR